MFDVQYDADEPLFSLREDAYLGEDPVPKLERMAMAEASKLDDALDMLLNKDLPPEIGNYFCLGFT